MKKFLLLILFTILLFGSFINAAAPSDLEPKTFTYYKGDINGSYIDEVQGENGTISGASFISDGKINGGYSFDGSSDYITLPAFGQTFWNNDFSISFWIRFDNVGSASNQYVFVPGDDSNINIIKLGTGGLRFNMYDGSSHPILIDQSDLSDDVWLNVIITRSKSMGTEIFLDNISKDSDVFTGNAQTITNNNALGVSTGLSSDFLPGDIDEFVLYNKTLNVTERNFIFLNNAPNEEQQYPYSTVSENISINNQTYNMTSDGGCIVWRDNAATNCNTTDDTPTITFETNLDGNCSLRATQSNTSSFPSFNNSFVCGTTDGTTHICTVYNVDSLSINQNYLFASCSDNSSNTTSLPLSIYYDVAPNISLNSPINNFSLDGAGTSITFNYTPTDGNGDNTTVKLYIDGSLEQTNNSVINGTNVLFTKSDLTYNVHTWNVSVDDGSTLVFSETRNFNVSNDAPVVNLNAPTNNSIVPGQTSALLNVTLVHNDSHNANVSFYNVNGSLLDTQTNISHLTFVTFTWTGLTANTSYIWFVNATDGVNETQSDNWYFNTSITAPNISSTSFLNGVDWITASCVGNGITYVLSINGSGESSGSINSCLYTFTSLDPDSSYNITFTATNGSSTSVSNISSTLKENVRTWIPQGDLDLKNIFEIVNGWKASFKKFFVESDSNIYLSKIWQNNSVLEFSNNNSGSYRFDNNVAINGNLIVGGCIQYNCSSSCITLGSCS